MLEPVVGLVGNYSDDVAGPGPGPRVKVDKKREWKNFKNIRRNAMLTGMFRRKSKGQVA